jgi:hypothetical protein
MTTYNTLRDTLAVKMSEKVDVVEILQHQSALIREGMMRAYPEGEEAH